MGQQYLSTDPNAGEPLGWTPRGEMVPGLRPAVTDEAGNPPGVGESLSRLLSLLEPMAHPQTLDDFGHLLMAPVDPTRGAMLPTLLEKLRGLLPSRQTTGSAIQRLGQELQHPVQVPGRAVEGVGTMLKGPEPPAPVATPKPRPGSFEDFFTADPARRAEIQSAREAYRLQPRVRTSASPGGTPSAAPPASTPPGSAPATSMRLTAEESQHLQQLIAEGYDEADVLQAIARVRAESSAPMTGGAGSGPGRLAQTKTATTPAGEAAPAKELEELEQAYQRLIAAGKSDAEALDLIQRQLTMRERMGLPSHQQIWNDFAYRKGHGGRPQR